MDGAGHPRSYRDLQTWQRAMGLVEMIYSATRTWPREEVYGLTSQIRRAVVSVPSNIAEGQGRTGAKEFIHHLSIAHGSLLEMETQTLIAQRLSYLPQEVCDTILAESAIVGRMINRLSSSLGRK